MRPTLNTPQQEVDGTDLSYLQGDDATSHKAVLRLRST